MDNGRMRQAIEIVMAAEAGPDGGGGAVLFVKNCWDGPRLAVRRVGPDCARALAAAGFLVAVDAFDAYVVEARS